jgi:hypothetical protein
MSRNKPPAFPWTTELDVVLLTAWANSRPTGFSVRVAALNAYVAVKQYVAKHAPEHLPLLTARIVRARLNEFYSWNKLLSDEEKPLPSKQFAIPRAYMNIS